MKKEDFHNLLRSTLDKGLHDDVFAWLNDGESFIIKNKELFVGVILPAIGQNKVLYDSWLKRCSRNEIKKVRAKQIFKLAQSPSSRRVPRSRLVSGARLIRQHRERDRQLRSKQNITVPRAVAPRNMDKGCDAMPFLPAFQGAVDEFASPRSPGANYHFVEDCGRPIVHPPQSLGGLTQIGGAVDMDLRAALSSAARDTMNFSSMKDLVHEMASEYGTSAAFLANTGSHGMYHAPSYSAFDARGMSARKMPLRQRSMEDMFLTLKLGVEHLEQELYFLYRS